MNYECRSKRYFKIKKRRLKKAFQEALCSIAENPLWVCKGGDLTGIYGYDVYYNRTNYEIAISHLKKMIS